MKHKNSEMRNYMDNEKRGYTAWWLLILALVILSVIALGITGEFGRLADVVFERQVFEQSYQYQSARQNEISTYRAQIAELEGQLQNPNLSETDKTNIETQLNAIRIRLNTAESQLGESK